MKAALQTKAKTSPSVLPAFTSVRNGLLQRKCACGGPLGPSGECEACRKKKLQHRSENLDQSSILHPPSSVLEIPPIVHEVLRSRGQPLDPQTREFMEPRFGHVFTQVRVHTDTKAAESTQAINALAYTVGQNVVFRNGAYRPETPLGKKLLAHELSHTLQQRAAESSSPAALRISQPEDATEREAEAVASKVVQEQESRVARVSCKRIARQPATGSTSAPAASAGEEPGERRARAAKELVAKLKAAGATYQQELKGRDWNNTKISDCTKFVQWALESAGEPELFGRKSATTTMMQSIIQKLQVDEKPPFRFTNPKAGDIMMWGGHVGIVYEVVNKKGTDYLVFAHMGTHGASLIGKSATQAKDDVYWLKAGNTAQIDGMGNGAFLGFWTPP